MKITKSILKTILYELNSQSDKMSERGPSMISVEETIKPRKRIHSVNIHVLKDRNQIAFLFKNLQSKIEPAKSLFNISKEASVIIKDLKSKGSIRYFDRPLKSNRKKKFKKNQKFLPTRKFSLNSDILIKNKQTRKSRKNEKPKELSGFIENKGSIFGQIIPAKTNSDSKKAFRQFELAHDQLNFKRKGSTFIKKANKNSKRKFSEITERTPHFGFSANEANNHKKRKNRRKKKNRKKKKSLQVQPKDIEEEAKESSEEDEDYYTQRILTMCRK
jgi:hypothetical protein